MTKPRWLRFTCLQIGLGLLALSLAIAAACLWWPADAIGPRNYRQIKLGMTAAEVEAVIGLPPGDHRTKRGVGGTRAAGNFAFMVQEEGIPANDLPSPPWGATRTGQMVTILWWDGNNYFISVALDEYGKVVGRYLSEVQW